MHDIQLHNTLSGKVEPFVPLRPGEVGMYTCGPTVYDYAHIGNFRTFVFQDILRRFLLSARVQADPRNESYRRGRSDHRERCRRGRRHSRVHGKVYSGVFRGLPHAERGITGALDTRYRPHPGNGFADQKSCRRIRTRIPAKARSITASRNLRITANFPRSISAASRRGRASIMIATKKKAPAISRCGRLPNPANSSGKRRSAQVVLGGISNVPRWP